MSTFVLDGHIVPDGIAVRGAVDPGAPPIVRQSAIGVDRAGPTWAFVWTFPELTRDECEFFSQTVCGGALYITSSDETRLLTRDKGWIDYGSAVIYAPRCAYFEANRFWQVEVRVELVGLAQQEAAVLVAVTLAAAALSGTEIELTWNDANDGEDGYRVERSADGLSGWTEIATAAADATTYTDSGLNPGETWYYRVRPYRNAEMGPYSNTASATTEFDLSEPSDLAAVANGETQIDLTWTDTATNEEGWKIERSLTGVGAWSQIDTVAGDADSYSDTGLDDGVEYFYRVRPYLGATNGDYSNTANATTDPTVENAYKTSGYTILDSCGYSVGNTPDRCFDGDTALQWTHAVDETHFLDVDLGKVYRISHIRRWKISGGQYNWTNARLYISNDPDNWGSVVLTFTTSTTSNAWSEHALSSPVDGRYFRLEVSQTGIANNVACGELQLKV